MLKFLKKERKKYLKIMLHKFPKAASPNRQADIADCLSVWLEIMGWLVLDILSLKLSMSVWFGRLGLELIKLTYVIK